MIPPSTYDCPICDQICPSLAQYISHYEKAHGRSAAEPDKPPTFKTRSTRFWPLTARRAWL